MAAAILAMFVMTFAVVVGNSAADPDMLQDICVADFTSGTTPGPFNFLFFIFIPSVSVRITS